MSQDNQDNTDKQSRYEKVKNERRLRNPGRGQQHQDSTELLTDAIKIPSDVEERSLSRQVPLSTPTGVGIINRIRAERLKIKNQLEALRVHWEGQVKIVEIQTEAEVREAKAFWDAKSVEIAESIKTYVQNALSDLEGERMKNRQAAIRKVHETTQVEIEKVKRGNLPDEVKQDCEDQIYATCLDTIERLMTNAIAEKYNLA